MAIRNKLITCQIMDETTRIFKGKIKRHHKIKRRLDTFYNFYYTWGYTPFLFLYPLIPIIFGATFKFFNNSNQKGKFYLLSILGIFFFYRTFLMVIYPFLFFKYIFVFFIILLFFLKDRNIKSINFIKNLVFILFIWIYRLHLLYFN